MHSDFLIELSCADAIAGDEGEVRHLLQEKISNMGFAEVFYDGLGSLIVHLPPTKTEQGKAAKLLFMAHMDEVGFIVRSISPIGMLYLLPVGHVLPKSCDMQLVRLTADDGRKLRGILNSTRDDNSVISDIYTDLGVDSEAEVRDYGVAEGRMVTFDTNASMLSDERVAGKALDDRVGCAALLKALDLLNQQSERINDVYIAFSSSEEVGTRGGKTVADLVKPDIAVAVDTANHPEMDRGFRNHRQLGAGFMLEHYDKTMSPNRDLLRFAKALFEKHELSYQRDMFGGGGTDAGLAHLVDGGRLALVIGIPLRYCHASCSIADLRDIEGAANAVAALAQELDAAQLDSFLAW